MNVALPILLLVFGGLTFWVLNESSLKWYLKTACISVFCLFTVIFWTSIGSFLGWPALSNDMPEKGLIHWVVIKEPNKITKSVGGIYILMENAGEPESNFLARFFGYSREQNEPRLYGLNYDRKLHEELEKKVMGKLRTGQPVLGKLTKLKGAKGKKGDSNKESKQEGEGSESQEQEWEFHELLPSEIHEKPTR
jgi:hypothetical protein